MTNNVTFIHTADLHIGAPMRGFQALTPEWEQRLQTAIVEAYDRVIDAALDRAVDFVIIAGDAFDASRPSYGDYLRFFAGLRKLDEAGIPVYLIAGNHDCFTSWARDIDRLPASAHMLGDQSPEFALFERDGEPVCLIGGRSYHNQVWPAELDVAEGISRTRAVAALSADHPRAAQAPFAIGVIHTGLDLDRDKAPANPADLLSADIDYWACGHLHKRLVYPGESNPRIVFPGCVQARDIKESGERGCLAVTLADGAPPHIEPIPTASVAFDTISVDVSACQTLADLRNLIQAHLFHQSGEARCEELVVSVVLVGQTDLHAFLAQPRVLDDVRRHINNAYPMFFCDSIADRTRPTFTQALPQREGLFSELLMRVSAEQKQHGEEMINYVQSEFVKRGVSVPASLSRRIGEFGEAAEVLALDLLEEERFRELDAPEQPLPDMLFEGAASYEVPENLDSGREAGEGA